MLPFWKTLPALIVACVLLHPALAAQPTVEITARHGQSWRGKMDGLPVLQLRGTHRERGEAHGKLAGKEIVQSCNQLASILNKRLPGGWSASIVLSKQFQLPERFRDELQGMLAGIEQSTTAEERIITAIKRPLNLDDLVLLNTADVFELFRCSQFSAWGSAAAGGELIVGRNFDYPALLPRENFCVLSIEPAESGLRPTIDALFFGFIGCGISAINDVGMYIAPDTGGPSPREVLPKEPITAGLVMRSYLETARPEAAVEELTSQVKAHFALPILLHVVPAKTELGQQTPIILEFTPSATSPTAVVRKPEARASALFVANHHVKNAADLAKGRCGILKSECEKCLASGQPIDFAAAKSLLHAARQDSTLISVVSWPHAGRLRAAIAEPGKVATECRFYEIDWPAIRAAK
ncbi:hypothetical protein [Anatilimnocola floriformis]|uniref:hypothetical protein n=1 Tax=Anatilimnocola floriformis TaxID=2948575 RepID=UPI0020C3E1C8|nr:hypothetical protein [Anatilimnocola floriformis]